MSWFSLCFLTSGYFSFRVSQWTISKEVMVVIVRKKKASYYRDADLKSG